MAEVALIFLIFFVFQSKKNMPNCFLLVNLIVKEYTLLEWLDFFSFLKTMFHYEFEHIAPSHANIKGQ